MRAARFVSVLGVFVALGGLLRAGSLVWGWVYGTNIPHSPREIDSLPQLLQFDQRTDAPMTVLDLPIWVRMLCAAPDLIQALALATSAFLLLPMLMAIGEGDSFGRPVQRHLHRISVVLVVTSVAVPLVDVLAQWQLSVAIWSYQAELVAAGIEHGYSMGTRVPLIPWLPLALGIVAAALSWAFRDGAALEKEAEGVV